MAEPVSPGEDVGRRTAEALESFATERAAAVERARRGYWARALEKPAPARLRLGQWALAVAGALTLGLLVVRHAAPRTLAFTAGEKPGVMESWVSAPDGHAVPLRFSDGTVLTLAPSSRARVVAIDPNGASLALENGAVHAEVVHRDHSAWRLMAGPLVVRVTGTRFDLSWSASTEEFSLAVSEGSVVVSGASLGEERPVRAGETMRVLVAEHGLSITSALAAPSAPSVTVTTSSSALDRRAEGTPSGSPPPAASAAPPVSEAHASADRSDPAAAAHAPDWRELARRGSVREAFAAADASGFDAACLHATASELLLLGDGARLSGNVARARQAFTRLRSAFPADPRRAAAAFALGKVAFDQAHSYAEAADWFATSIREQPGGSLAREAAGRLIEARRRSGDQAGARAAAENYLAHYADGPHADLARSLLR